MCEISSHVIIILTNLKSQLAVNLVLGGSTRAPINYRGSSFSYRIHIWRNATLLLLMILRCLERAHEPVFSIIFNQSDAFTVFKV